ncbi:MAG: isochorismatase [Nitrospirae bacterium]|nr:isochorismatase [Nitrospirota bacterium]
MPNKGPHNGLPLPAHFDPGKTGEVGRVPYLERAGEAARWAKTHSLRPAADDRRRLCLVAVDVQNTFCIPGFELYVAGRSGTGAVDDNRRLCEFIYRNLAVITEICPTMDTHRVMQIFHPLWLVNDKGEHPAPFTLVSEEDILKGLWKFNPTLCSSLGITEEYGRRHILYYTRKLKEGGKYDLTIWPYHAMLGGIGHALVASVEEAIFFHSVARSSQPDFHVKGDRPLTEHYSVLGPEVLQGQRDEPIGQKSDKFYKKLLEFDAVVIAGQAKSHCVAWTIDDLLKDILAGDRSLVEKVYLLDDCTSSVVVPGVMDYTEQAEAAFERFADAGMHVVHSTDPVESWPGIRL